LLLAGLPETATSIPGHLYVLLARGAGPGSAPGPLASRTTRRSPYVQLTDLAPTALRALGIPRPGTMTGRPAYRAHGTHTGTVARVGALVDDDRAAHTEHTLLAPFFGGWVAVEVVLFVTLAVALALLRPSAARRRLLAATRLLGLCAATVPASTFLAQLAPWWRAGHPAVAYGVLIAAWSAAIGVAATFLATIAMRTRPPVLAAGGLVAAATFAVFVGDLLAGATLQLGSLAGYSPLVAGRFHGIGNIAFGILAAAALLAAAAAAGGCRRRTVATALVVGLGAVAVAVDGAPSWGDDFGGVVALVPAFVLLALLASGARVTWRRVVLAVVAGIVVVAGVAAGDYLRPPADRTHIGRFVAVLLAGGGGTVVHRKALASLHLLTHNPAVPLLIPALIVCAVILARPFGPFAGLQRAFDARPALRHGLVATLVAAVIGGLVNDSGVLVAAIVLAVAVPLAIAAGARAARRTAPVDGAEDTRVAGPDESRPVLP
jgi:hypothetical protein